MIDFGHKAVYAFATGAVVDLLAGRPASRPGEKHAAVRPGRHEDVGLPPRGT